MRLCFDYDAESKKIVFYGAGFEISQKAETYEEIAEFSKDIIENCIGIPGLKHKEKQDKVKPDFIALCEEVEQCAEWETVTEIKNNTVCGDNARISYKRCSNCKQPLGWFSESFYCGNCGKKMKLKGGD